MIDLFAVNEMFPIPMIVILVTFVLVLFNLKDKKKKQKIVGTQRREYYYNLKNDLSRPVDTNCTLYAEDLEYIQQNNEEYFNNILGKEEVK